MGWWIFWGIIAAVIAFFVWAVNADNERQRINKIERDARQAAYDAAKAKFMSDNYSDIEFYPCKMEGRDAILSNPGDTVIHLVQFMSGVEFLVKTDRQIAIKDLRSVAFEQGDVVQTYQRTVSTPVSVAKKKSAIGRGLVGGLLLGPAGLVLGAASGVSTTSKIQHVTTTETAERTVAGPPTVVLTTKDRQNPFVKIEMKTADEAKAWVLWIGDQLAA